jgi:hypothetical protein
MAKGMKRTLRSGHCRHEEADEEAHPPRNPLHRLLGDLGVVVREAQ